MKRLRQKQETFCVKYFELGNASKAAIEAGYSPKYVATNTTKMLALPNIQARLKELRGKTENDAVMNVKERKEHLSEIARDDTTDTSIRAIDVMNKMDRIYSEGVQVNFPNAQIAVLYREALKEAQEEYKKLTEGEVGDETTNKD